MKNVDVLGICNALVDILVRAEDHDLQELGLKKGVMHLVDSERQKQVLNHVHQHQHHVELGGSALNAIRTLAQLGQKTTFVGMVGQDSYGKMIRERMDHLKIHAKLGHSQEPTGTCVILITPDGERTMNTHLGASRLYTIQDIPKDAIREAKIFHFCGYQWDTESQKKAIYEAIHEAKSHGTLVSFDVADPFVVEHHRKDFHKIVEEEADIVFANKEEARMLYGSFEEAAQKIASTGAIAVIKLGAEGALVKNQERTFRVPPYPTTVVDTTAAGDMFAAGFLFGLSRGLSLEECGSVAALLASDVISRVGATVSPEALTKAKKIAKV